MCQAGILGRKAAKRASGRSTVLKVSLLTDDLIAVTSHFHKVIDLRMLSRAVKIKPFIGFTRIWYTGRIRKEPL